jgi:hypothetical protein
MESLFAPTYPGSPQGVWSCIVSLRGSAAVRDPVCRFQVTPGSRLITGGSARPLKGG